VKPLRANSKTVERFSGEGAVTKMLAYLFRQEKKKGGSVERIYYNGDEEREKKNCVLLV